MECCCFWYIVGGVSLTIVMTYILFKKAFCTNKTADLSGKHVLITGGSEGIGLAVAEEVLKRGAHVTLVSRSRAKLEQAQSKLHEIASLSMRKVHIRPFDVCSNEVDKMLTDAESALGPVYMLVNCAGFSTPARLEDLSIDEVKMMMDVNFLGTFSVTQAVVKRMKTQEDDTTTQANNKALKGVIVLTSSQGGLFGFFGFSAYSASKAAVIKFGEAIHMELAPHNISVTVSLPPDTDTPGFTKENISKPPECKIISESGGLFKAEEVAKALVTDALRGKFFSYVGFESFMLSTMCAGMSPLTHYADFILQVFLSGIFRLVSSFYLFGFSRTVTSQHMIRSRSKKME